MSKVGIFGAGWVGLVTGACFAELGHDVVVRDVLAEKIEALQAGETPIHEPGLPELIRANRERLRFTTDPAEAADGADFLYVCVGTPSTYAGDADLSAVWSVLDDLPKLTGRPVLVMKSTVPVGTGEKVRAALDARGLEHVGYVSNPEFLSEGTAVRDFMNADRIVVGAFEPEDGDGVEALHENLDAAVVRSDVASAEMIKLAANAFLMTRISFINEIANVCELVGADVEEVARGIGLDPRLGPHFLRAGIGYGGSCFPKDASALKQLASNSGYHFQLLSAVIEVNELQKRRVIAKLQKHLGKLRGKRVALLGLSFKPNTDDMREAPSIVLASRLLAEGAEVRGWDPVAHPGELMKGVDVRDTVLDAVRDSDAAVVVTEWEELRDLASPEIREAMRTPLIVDGRNLLDPRAVEQLGFTYEGIGRASSSFLGLPETAEPEREPAKMAPTEAIILAGGKAERLGEAAEGRPKALVHIERRPLAAYQVALLKRAGVERVIFSVAAGQEELFERELEELGVDVVTVGEPEPLGRGGGLRLAAQARESRGPVYAMNGDELFDLDLRKLHEAHETKGGAATITVAPLQSHLGVVEVDGDDVVRGFREAPRLPFWVNTGLYVLEEEAIDRLPERGDHEATTFPQLAQQGRLRAFRHEGLWLTVNTPKDLRIAQELVKSDRDRLLTS